MVVKRAKGRIKLDIEIKPYGREEDLTEKVVGLIEKNNIVKQCIVTSFDYDVLVYVKQLNPKIRTSFLLKSPVKDVSIKDVDIFSVEKHYVTAKLVKNIHRNDKSIHVWTVNNIKDMQRFKDFGVDYIITDNIDGFRTINNNEQIEGDIFSNIEKIVQFS
jgi:glycerophosphoryl diester phosphodiesterase